MVHEQKKSYECTFCGLSFARKERLKQHMATDGVHGDITIVKDESVVIPCFVKLQPSNALTR